RMMLGMPVSPDCCCCCGGCFRQRRMVRSSEQEIRRGPDRAWCSFHCVERLDVDIDDDEEEGTLSTPSHSINQTGPPCPLRQATWPQSSISSLHSRMVSS